MTSHKISQQDTDAVYMTRALRLAEYGTGWVTPNPLVGCVIVRDEKILGEGFHHRHGSSHAEVEALAHARKQGHDVRGATMYITLEPCHHVGNTPPCTEAIVEAGIQRVVYATRDVHPTAGGGGVFLRGHGIDIVEGVLEDEARYMNRVFFHWVQTGLPYVCAKVAVSHNDKLARHKGSRALISGSRAQQFVHHLRQHYDAVLVGSETVRIDDPRLNVRFPLPAVPIRHPLRLIIDPELTIPQTAHVIEDERVCIFTTQTAHEKRGETFLPHGGRVVPLPSFAGKILWKDVLASCAEQQVTSVLVEGGQRVLGYLLDEHTYVNEWILVRAPEPFDGGLDFVPDAQLFYKRFQLVRTESLEPDVAEYYTAR